MDMKQENWQRLNSQLISTLNEVIVQMQKNRVLQFFSVKKYCQYNVTKDIQASFLDFVNEKPEQAIKNIADTIEQSIHHLKQDIEYLERVRNYELYPAYTKAQLKTANAELETFEYWFRIIINFMTA
jgi:hypothetical protein